MQTLCNTKYFLNQYDYFKPGSLVLLSIAWSLLFYDSPVGFNALLFTLLLMAAQGWYRAEYLHATWSKITLLAWLVSALAVAAHGSALAIVGLISLTLVASCQQQHPGSSPWSQYLTGIYSLLLSLLLDVFSYFLHPTAQAGNRLSILRYLRLLLLPGLVCIAFFGLYMASSSGFEQWVSGTLDFLSPGQLLFTGAGFWLLYGLLFFTKGEELVRLDSQSPLQLLRQRKQGKRRFALYGLRQEYLQAVILFAGLNVLLVTFHLHDLLSAGRYLNHTESLSGLVHQGVYTLIFSIFCAIALILYHFRGNLNFYKANRPLKRLVYGWISLNIVLIMSTAAKNMLYIDQFGLTYKRIGVFFFLFLCLTGLLTAWLKVQHQYSIWYLLRHNSQAVLLGGLLFCLLPWTNLITSYNLSHQLGLSYLIGLDDANTHQLHRHFTTHDTILPSLTEANQDSWRRKFSRLQHREQHLLSDTYLDYVQQRYLKSQAP